MHGVEAVHVATKSNPTASTARDRALVNTARTDCTRLSTTLSPHRTIIRTHLLPQPRRGHSNHAQVYRPEVEPHRDRRQIRTREACYPVRISSSGIDTMLLTKEMSL